MVFDPVVFVVDDDATIRIYLRELLSVAGHSIETYESAEAFLAAYDGKAPGCLVLDIFMPGMSGLEMQREMRRRGDSPPVIFLTSADEVSMAVQAMREGAIDFVQKPVDPAKLLELVDKGIAIDLRRRSKRLLREQISERAESLSSREREVMKWVVRGKPNRAIAQVLDISVRTVEVHRKNVFEKMHAESLPDLVRQSLELDL